MLCFFLVSISELLSSTFKAHVLSKSRLMAYVTDFFSGGSHKEMLRLTLGCSFHRTVTPSVVQIWLDLDGYPPSLPLQHCFLSISTTVKSSVCGTPLTTRRTETVLFGGAPHSTVYSIASFLTIPHFFLQTKPRPNSPSLYRRTEPTPFPPPDLHLSHVRVCPSSAAPLRQRNRQQQAPNQTHSLWGLQIQVMGLASPSKGTYFQSNSRVSQPMFLWGRLVFITNFLKTINGFIEIFTEANLHTMLYLSCSKSRLFFHLPVDSPGLLVSSCFSPEEQIVLLPLILWRHLSISITVMLSFGAVRSGHEDAAEFVSTSFRGADLILTLQLKMTISLLSDHVGKATSMHSSTVLNSLVEIEPFPPPLSRQRGYTKQLPWRIDLTLSYKSRRRRCLFSNGLLTSTNVLAEFVTNKSHEESQFCRGFGGIGGMFRYQLDMRTFDE
ncbi:hypothetical protein N665_1134s0007 [Sinapis alba]|nr:hypothetical protein N665_1134s0007 [Sinapis alba]